MDLVTRDAELLQAARRIIQARFKEGQHHVGAAVRTTNGSVFAAVHLETSIGRVAVCAEAIALGMAVAHGEGQIESIVAVDRNGHVVSPCGMCREMISDYGPGSRVIISESPSPKIVRIGELLPLK